MLDVRMEQSNLKSQQAEMCLRVAQAERRGYHDLAAESFLLATTKQFVSRKALRYSKYLNLDERDDLLQEASIGMLQGIRRFDPARKVGLLTYASYWVDAYMLAWLCRHRSLMGMLTRVQRKRLEAGPCPSCSLPGWIPQLGCAACGWRSERGGKLDLGTWEGCQLAGRMRAVCPLDDRVAFDDGEGEQSYQDLLRDEKPLADEELVIGQKVRLVREALGELTPRERFVLRRRAQDGGTILEKIGEEMSVTRERVRQIEAKAIKKMRDYLRRRGIEVEEAA